MNEIEVYSIFDNNIHNYYKVEVEDCVQYNICGYITKNIKCNNCLTVLNGMFTKQLILK